MKKIIFGITSLTLGGAERVLVDLANELSKRKKYQITIFTIYGQGEFEKQLSQNIKIESIYNYKFNELNKIHKKIIIPLKILLTKSLIYKKFIKNKYDVEVAFLEGPITRIFSCGKEKNKKVAWVHNDISQVFGKGIKAKLKRNIDSKLYNKFSKLIFVSQNNLESFKKFYPENKAQKQVIYNYIDKEQVLKKANEQTVREFNENEINLLTVARLVPQKALDRLIKVHSKLIKEGLKHNLYLIGEGPERTNLEQAIKSENCKESVKLLGKKENPYPYMKKADYICLLSNYEGYPMTIVEAKILGKYILITDTAAKEAVKNYNKSKVFENSEKAIYEGLKNILQNHSKTNKEKNLEKNLDNYKSYDNAEIIEQIEKILEN